jgi:hypothetical protein
MTSIASASIDFRSVARELVSAQPSRTIAKSSASRRSDGSELIPAEVTARLSREGNEFRTQPMPLGSTVDQEGLTNTYAVMPSVYPATFPSAEQARRYMVQGACAMLFVVGLIATAFAVS